MSNTLDPYHKFLGIPAREQPPHHYRLLGVPLFEENEHVLEWQFEMRRQQLSNLFATEFANVAQTLLDELAEAISVLRDPARRQAYDDALRSRLGAASPDRPVPTKTARTEIKRTWLVGSAGDCDIVIHDAKVSRLHCRLTEVNGDFFLQDTGSRNGTFVNGERITSRTRVTPDDVITLGRTSRLPWPAAEPASAELVVRIGRALDNDWVLDDDSVSAHHAMAQLRNGVMVLQDLGSTNGTSVGVPDNRIACCQIAPSDALYFGRVQVLAARLWEPN